MSAHASLTALNCKPVRFQDDATDSLVLDHPHGLNASKDYGFVFVDTTMIDKETKEKMQKLQPKAKVCNQNRPHADKTQFIFLVRSIDLARAMRDFDITVGPSSRALADDSARVDRGQADQVCFALQCPHGRGE